MEIWMKIWIQAANSVEPGQIAQINVNAGLALC